MSFSSNRSRDLESESSPPFLPRKVPLSGFLLGSVPLFGVLIPFLECSVSMEPLWTTELLFSPVAASVSPAQTDTAGTPLWCNGPVCAGLTWGLGWGRSTWGAWGWRAGMSRRSSPPNARESRKQNLLTPTEATCILTGRQSRFSHQGCSDFQHHFVPSSHHHTDWIA